MRLFLFRLFETLRGPQEGHRVWAWGVGLSAVLVAGYAQGGVGCVLGFVALVPWLHTLDVQTSWRRTLLSAWAMSVAYSVAGFSWFAAAVGHYTQLGTGLGVLLLMFAAPLFQPQLLVFALVRRAARRGPGRVLPAVVAAAAWVFVEWAAPKILGDTYGYGLYPARLWRQAADLAGTAGLTVLLLWANEAGAALISTWHGRTHGHAHDGSTGAGARGGWGAGWRAAAVALLIPAALAAYGALVLSGPTPPEAQPLRVALVQSNIADYEARREQQGAEGVVREVLDTHFAMSYDAVERHRADAVLWSETVYPTTFGHPKSDAGAEFDREILDVVEAARVPFVFGTYDVDGAGEYNAAAFVSPGQGLLGFYRKTRLFMFTEYLPGWLDTPVVRRGLPWAGAWQAGNGARVFPLRLADGREVPVQPLICRDDTDPQLAIDGARLGAQALLTMSNDAWFARAPQGAAWHEAAAAFRSIETRLPQFRVTPTGHSAAIDRTGAVVAATRVGERTLVIGDLPVAPPTFTLMVRWGDWLGPVAGWALLGWAVVSGWQAWDRRRAGRGTADDGPVPLPERLWVLPPAARWGAGGLRLLARGSLLWMAAAFLFGLAPWQPNTLAQIRLFTLLFLLPELLAWLLMRAYAVRAQVVAGEWVLTRGAARLVLPLHEVVAVEPWALPSPTAGAGLRLCDGRRWSAGLAGIDPPRLARALVGAGAPLQAPADGSGWAWRLAQTRAQTWRGRLHHPLLKFVLFPLLLALPAFHVHQHIAYGSGLGEYHAFGLAAFLGAFALWWAAWTIAVVICAAVLRAGIESGSVLSVVCRPGRALEARRWLERGGLVALYLGLPLWLLARIAGS